MCTPCNMQHSNFVFLCSIALGVYCRLAGLPPIHFGREDGVERTLLRMACQSETLVAPLWQGGTSIRFLWHIGSQSDFDELVSMAFRPVDRGFGRMGSISTTFRPVKSRFGRTRALSTSFHPPKGGFGRTGMLLVIIARSKDTPRTGPPFRFAS